MEVESLRSKMAMRAFHFAFQLSNNYDFPLSIKGAEVSLT